MVARTVACFKDLGVGVEEGVVPVTSEKARPCRVSRLLWELHQGFCLDRKQA